MYSRNSTLVTFLSTNQKIQLFALLMHDTKDKHIYTQVLYSNKYIRLGKINNP